MWKGTGLEVSGSLEAQGGILEARCNWQVSPLLRSEAEGEDGEVFFFPGESQCLSITDFLELQKMFLQVTVTQSNRKLAQTKKSHRTLCSSSQTVQLILSTRVLFGSLEDVWLHVYVCLYLCLQNESHCHTALGPIFHMV